MSFKKIFLLFLFFYAGGFFLSAQKVQISQDSFPGWYLDTSFGDRAYHFKSSGEYEGFGGDESAMGSWKIKSDTVFICEEWFYAKDSPLICGLAGDKEFIPFNDTMIFSIGKLYELRSRNDSEYVPSIRWIPGSKNKMSQRVNFNTNILYERFGDFIFHPDTIDISNCEGYYCWSGARSHESLHLKKSGKFILESGSYVETNENWKDNGTWQISGDTLILKVKFSKQIGFETSYALGFYYFYFNENYWMEKNVKREGVDVEQDYFTKKLYPLTKKQFRKYGHG